MKLSLWRIIPQVQTIKGVDMEVECKSIRFFPYTCKKTGETKFGRLGITQVVIQRANWKSDECWKIRFNYKTSRFHIIFNETIDPIDPRDKRHIDKQSVLQINEDRHMTTDGILELLNKRIRNGGPNAEPDHEFIEKILLLLITTAEECGGRKKKSA